MKCAVNKMNCQRCPAYDSYQSQGGRKRLQKYGWCHEKKRTVHQKDSCNIMGSVCVLSDYRKRSYNRISDMGKAAEINPKEGEI